MNFGSPPGGGAMVFRVHEFAFVKVNYILFNMEESRFFSTEANVFEFTLEEKNLTLRLRIYERGRVFIRSVFLRQESSK